MFCNFSAQEHAEGNRELILDVDPEAVRRGVKTLMQQVAQIERERVSMNFLKLHSCSYERLALIVTCSLKGRLQDRAEQH